MLSITTSGSSPSATSFSQAAERYEFKTVLAVGRTGTMYHAHDRLDNRKVAIKLLAHNLSSRVLGRQFRERARQLALVEHPRVALVRDYGYHYGLAFLVSEEVAGCSLEEYLEARGSLDWKTFYPIFNAILEALTISHAAGVIHGDVQPSHVILAGSGRFIDGLALTGFGFPDLDDDEVSSQADTRHVSVVDAIAPERLLRQPCDHRLDLYAAGALAYQLLSGSVPFAGASAERVFSSLYEPATPLRDRLPEGHAVPERALALIDQMLEKQPDQRPASAAECLARMNQAGAVIKLEDARLATLASVSNPAAEDIAAARPRSGVVEALPMPPAAKAPAQSWMPTPQLALQVAIVMAFFAGFAASGWLIVMQLRPAAVDPAPPPVEALQAPVEAPSATKSAEFHTLFNLVGRALDERQFGKAAELLDGLQAHPDFPAELHGTLEAFQARLELSSKLERAARLESSGQPEEALLLYADLEKRYPNHAHVPKNAGDLEGAFVLEVKANVRGVVSVDGEPVGVTPFISLIPIEANEISVTRKGYRTWARALAAQEGGRLSLEANLVRRGRGERADRKEVDANASPFMDLMEMKID